MAKGYESGAQMGANHDKNQRYIIIKIMYYLFCSGDKNVSRSVPPPPFFPFSPPPPHDYSIPTTMSRALSPAWATSSPSPQAVLQEEGPEWAPQKFPL